MNQLTERQTEILEFIKEFKTERGYPPTRVEIARHFDFTSANAASDHLKALEAKGLLKVKSGVARGIQLLPEAA